MSALAVVLEWEMLRQLRHPWRRVAWAGGVLGLGGTWLLFVAVTVFFGARSDAAFFGCLLVCGMLHAVVVGALAVSSLTIEKEQRAFTFVQLSDLGTTGYLRLQVCRWLLRGLPWYLMATPLLFACASWGRVRPVQCVLAVLLCSALLAALTGLALLAGTLLRDRQNAFGLLVLAMLLLVGLPWFGLTLLISDGRAPPWLLPLTNPIVAAVRVGLGQELWVVAAHCLLLVGVGEWCCRAAGWLLPRRLAARERRPWRARVGLWWRQRVWRPKPAIGDNPVAWRDYHYLYGGRRRLWWTFGLALGGLPLLFGTMGLLFGEEGWADALVGVEIGLLGFAGLAAVVAFLWPAYLAANAFRVESRSETLDMLVVSGLTDEEIVRGKLEAIARATKPWLVCGVLAWLGVVVWVGVAESWVISVWLFAVPALLAPGLVLTNLKYPLTPQGQSGIDLEVPALAGGLAYLLGMAYAGMAALDVDDDLIIVVLCGLGGAAVLLYLVRLRWIWNDTYHGLREHATKAIDRRLRGPIRFPAPAKPKPAAKVTPPAKGPVAKP